MPELPEVETVRSGLDKHVVGRTIDTVEVLHPRAVRRHLAGPADFAAVLRGRTFTGARRRGKYLWLPVAEDALLAHLGMSGQLLVGDAERPVSGHVRVRFTFTDQGPDLRFTDQRTFGHLVWASGGAQLPPLIAQVEFVGEDVPRVVALIVAISQAIYAFAPVVFGMIREFTPHTAGAESGAAPGLLAIAGIVQGLAICAFLAGRRRAYRVGTGLSPR